MGLLETYQSAAGQFFNLQKSQLFLGKCSARRKRRISSILGIQEVSTHLKYLGTPICFGTPKRSHFLPLLDVVQSKLSAWKAKTMSFAGRLILIKHVISSLPILLAAILPLPASICNEIERHMRLFLWSGNAPIPKINYVNWATVTLLKAEGGLGIRKLTDVNNASFIKLGWQASTSTSLWSTWFKDRYFKFRPIWSSENSIYGSCIWKKICRLAPIIHQGSSWIFGNGQSINVWHDSWTASDPISTCFPHHQFPRDQRLSSLFQSGSWVTLELLPNNVTQHLHHLLSDLSPNLAISDTLTWRDTHDGKVSLCSAWHRIRSRAQTLHWPKLIWNNISPHKVNCFGWRLMHNKLPTEIRLKRLGFSLASRCIFCCADEDSVGHLFFSCDHAKAIWSWFLHLAGAPPPIRFSASSIWKTLSKESDVYGYKYMAAIFIIILFHLWQACNEAIFENRRLSLHNSQVHLTEAISFSLKQISHQFVSFHLSALFLSLRIVISN